MKTYTSEKTGPVEAIQWMGASSLSAIHEAEVPFQPTASPHAIRFFVGDASRVVGVGDWLVKEGGEWFVLSDQTFTQNLGYVSA